MSAKLLPMTRQRADASTLAAIYVAALVVIPATLVVGGLPLSISPASLVGLVMTMCWLCAHMTTTLGMAKGSNPVRTALYLVAVSVLASYCYAMYRYTPGDEIRSADQSLVLLLIITGMTLLVCDGIRTLDRLDALLRAVVIGSGFVAVVGILQFMVGLDLTEYLKLPGLRATADYGFITDRAGFRRPAATTGTPIEFGVLCAMALPLAIHFGFRSQVERRGMLLWWGCTMAIAGGAFYSVSRSAMLGLATVFVTLFLGWPMRRRAWGIVAGVAFLVAVKITSNDLLGTIFGLFSHFSSDSSVSYRTHDYPIASELITQSPWLGTGWGTHYAPKHIIFDNQYLLVLVEGGAVGLCALVALFITAIVVGIRIRRRSRDIGIRDRALSLIAALTVPVIGAITFDLLSFKTVTGLLFIVIGGLGALDRITLTLRDAPNSARGTRTPESAWSPRHLRAEGDLCGRVWLFWSDRADGTAAIWAMAHASGLAGLGVIGALMP